MHYNSGFDSITCLLLLYFMFLYNHFPVIYLSFSLQFNVKFRFFFFNFFFCEFNSGAGILHWLNDYLVAGIGLCPFLLKQFHKMLPVMAAGDRCWRIQDWSTDWRAGDGLIMDFSRKGEDREQGLEGRSCSCH